MRTATALFGLMIGLPAIAAAQDPSPRVLELYERARAEQASGADDAAVADYVEIIRLSPKLAAAYNNLGRLYYNTGHYNEAIPVLQRGLRIDPSMHPAEAMLGSCYYQIGQYDKADALLQSAVRAMPDDRFVRLTLVRTLIRLGRSDDAIRQLQMLATKDPKDQEAWYMLGKLQLQLSQEAFARVHAIDPDAPLAHELSGEIMESMKNTPGAIAEYKKAVAASPTDTGALEHLADAYWHSGAWPQAREGFVAYLKQDPANCFAHWKLANTLDELGESADEALAQTDIALKTCPALAQARVERARILLRLGRAPDALPELLLAEKSAPDESSIQSLLARTYKALGDTQHATEANAKFQRLQQAEHTAAETHAADVLGANP